VSQRARITPFLTGDPAEQSRSHGAPSAGDGVVVVSSLQAARRHRYRRRHTVHYYTVVIALLCAAAVVALDAIGFVERDIGLSTAAFAAVGIATLAVFVAFFWGFYMLMSGSIPAKRIRRVVPHAALGVIAPLLYTLNLSAGLDDVGRKPVSGVSLGCSLACLLILCLQFWMGKMIVRPARLHVIRTVSTGPTALDRPADHTTSTLG